jgi:hypothetical protein
MKADFGDDIMDVRNLRKCILSNKSCCAGEMSVLDEHKPGRPIYLTRDENQFGVDIMIQESLRINQRDIVLKLGITRNQERVHHIFETLNYRKFGVRLDPTQLTNPMKLHRKSIVHKFLSNIVSKGIISSRILPLE